MREYLPYNVLLAVAIAATGFMVFYNLTMRETFPVMISYDMPAAPEPEEAAPRDILAASAPAQPGEEEANGLESVTFPLDLNLATEAELMFIPSVGEVMSQRIVQYRSVLGAYTSLEQLKEIKGIGDAVFEKISPYLYVG